MAPTNHLRMEFPCRDNLIAQPAQQIHRIAMIFCFRYHLIINYDGLQVYFWCPQKCFSRPLLAGASIACFLSEALS